MSRLTNCDSKLSPAQSGLIFAVIGKVSVEAIFLFILYLIWVLSESGLTRFKYLQDLGTFDNEILSARSPNLLYH
jgi:hypothetical protein